MSDLRGLLTEDEVRVLIAYNCGLIGHCVAGAPQERPSCEKVKEMVDRLAMLAQAFPPAVLN